MNTKMTVGVIILLLLVGAAGVYMGMNYRLTPAGSTPVTATPTAEIVQISPTSTPTVTPALTQTPLPTATPTPDEKAVVLAAIKAGLIAKYGPDAGSMTITVSKIEGNFAQGGASDEGGGGMWFAAKVNGTWKLVWDGNGTISCDTIAPYNFPVSMIPECWDDANQTSVTR